jgi:hypothetical protein
MAGSQFKAYQVPTVIVRNQIREKATPAIALRISGRPAFANTETEGHRTKNEELNMKKPTISWIIDSGATHHMTWQSRILTNQVELSNPVLFSTAGPTRLEANIKGDVKVKLRNGRELIIKDVHFVPGSRVNLLSTNRMVRNGWDVRLTTEGGNIKKGRASLTLTRDGGLWRTSHFVPTNSAPTFPAGTAEPEHALLGNARSLLEEEHRRLGHIGRYKLLELAKEGKLTGSQSTKTLLSHRSWSRRMLCWSVEPEAIWLFVLFTLVYIIGSSQGDKKVNP